ncbi:MAG: hypothetical protein WCO06_07420 [Candidatus Roizmanbacteria bacterium]
MGYSNTSKIKADSKNRRIIVAFVISVAVFFVIELYIGYNNQTSIRNTQITNPYTTISQPRKNGTRWALKKIMNGKEEIVFSFPENINKIVRWGDLLIYGSESYTSNVQLFSLNIRTGERKTIYDQSSRNDFTNGRNSRYVSNIQILQNTLYFSIGGYLTTGALFSINLPPTSEPIKLSDGANNNIQYWKNRYWIMNSEGDACWGNKNYSLIDLVSKKVTNIVTSKVGCIEGEEMIDIDKRNRMILAFHTAGSGEGDEDSNGMYQYIIAILLSNPQNKEGVIAKQNMPANIRSIVYLNESDKLLLVGNEKYLFDFATNSITKTDMILPTPIRSESTQNKTVEETIKDLVLPEGYNFVLQ